MKLSLRHYILIAIIIGLFIFNIVKHRRDEHARLAALQSVNTLSIPAWAAFDKAAAHRDAPASQFQPAFDALRAVTEGPATETPDMAHALTDVIACKTWLFFYRNPQWQANAKKHVNGCTQYHHDTIA